MSALGSDLMRHNKPFSMSALGSDLLHHGKPFNMRTGLVQNNQQP